MGLSRLPRARTDNASAAVTRKDYKKKKKKKGAPCVRNRTGSNTSGQLAGRKRKAKKEPRPHPTEGGNWPLHPSREGGKDSSLSTTPSPPPPAARPCRFHRWGEEMPTNRAKDRADAQRLVATRLLDRVHDPLGHFGRLQRIYPRAW